TDSVGERSAGCKGSPEIATHRLYQRFHAVLLAVKTAAEWLKFRSRIDFHIRSPPNQEYTNIDSIYFIIANMRSLIKPKISLNRLIFSLSLFYLFRTLSPPPPP
ncbi:hypothetical protein P4H42_23385, partial [Paenibacillus macerans]|uniref:hypothetical protein n=1 Tax=Paenibacillus macerans TaxID=44252 RepID=UPI002DBD3014